MTDRELLELAAKAAGYDVVWATDLNGFVFRPFGHGPRTMFSPLNNDGEALRLAVMCDISIDMNRVDGIVIAEFGYARRIGVMEQSANDMHSATRRAIVRAAAEIGKAMR